MDSGYLINWVGVTMFGLASIVILGLLLVLLFLALARHRMLALVILGFVVLFVGLPLIALISSYRATGHQRARQVAEIGWRHDQVRESYGREQWRQFQPPRPNRRAKPAKPEGVHSTVQVHEQRMEEAKMLAELAPDERLTHDWPHTLAGDGSDGVQAELDKSTDMESLQTAEGPAGSEELLAAGELPDVAADVTKAAATPPSADDEAPSADLTVQAPRTQRPDWVLTPPEVVDGDPAEVLVSDPFETGQECDQDIQRRMIAAIQRFADRQCQQIGAPRGLNLPVQAEDLDLISQQRFVDVIPTSVGPMTQVHRMVVYDEDFRRILDRRISEAIVGRRLVRTGVFSGGVLLLVGSLFGILKGAARRQAKAATK
jgi:hypothetical protein